MPWSGWRLKLLSSWRFFNGKVNASSQNIYLLGNVKLPGSMRLSSRIPYLISTAPLLGPIASGMISVPEQEP